MNITFEKWHGNGNDFVIVNSIDNEIKIKKSFVKTISNRNTGIGFDQLIHICLPTKSDKHFFIRFYNSDGSEAGMCLNGIRCGAKYIWDNSLHPLSPIKIQTKTKNILCSLKKKDVSVLIEQPSEMRVSREIDKKIEAVAGKKFFFSNIGNNHLCIEKKSIEKLNLNDLYKSFDETLKNFDVNLSIFKKNKADIQIMTYENGVGETLSCGSASLCVATKFLNQNQNMLKVSSMGGELRFKLDKNGILMSGPASFSYKGNINE